MLAAGPARDGDSSEVVGEEGGPDVEVGVSPWGSDHRAVVSSFDGRAGAGARPGRRRPAGGRAGRAGDPPLRARRRRRRARGRDRRGSDPGAEADRRRCRSSTPPTTSRRCSGPSRWRRAATRAVLLERRRGPRLVAVLGRRARSARREIETDRAAYRARRAGRRSAGATGRATSSTTSAIFRAGDPSLYVVPRLPLRRAPGPRAGRASASAGGWSRAATSPA